MKRTCIQCGKEFELTNSEIGFYKKRKLALPKRCKACREQNKKGNEKETQNQNTNKTTNKTTNKKQNDKQQAKGAVSPDAANLKQTVQKQGVQKQNGVSEKGNANRGSKKKKAAAAVAVAAGLIYFALTGTWPTVGDTVPQKPQQSVEQTVPEEIYTFRTQQQLDEHFEKHGIEMGFASADEYLDAANLVIHSEDALHKIEAEDGDDVYFIEDTNEFVVVSTDDYIRTYFEPEDGIEYFERQ